MLNIKIRDEYLRDIIHGILIKDTWKSLTSCDILLIRHDNNCGYTYNEKAYAHLTDSLGDIFLNRSLTVKTVTRPPSVLTGERGYNHPFSFNQYYIYLAIFKQVIQFIKGKEYSICWEKHQRVALWRTILEKANPKIVIGTLPDKFLCQAGNGLGIPVYDLQHGVISDDHPWYGAKYRIDTPIEILPTGFLCWDDQSVATLSKWVVEKGIRVIKIGNPWFLRFMKANQDDRLVQDVIPASESWDEARPSILVSLQWGLMDFYEDVSNGVMIESLERVILDTYDQYNWVLRLHPVQLRVKYELELVTSYLTSTFGAEITNKWMNDSFLPLPLVLRNVDLHITYNSMIVIEAAWGGIRSGILNPRIKDGDGFENYYVHERSLGIAEVIPQDSDLIKQWIIHTLAKGRAEPTMDTTGQELDAFINEIVDWGKK
ncbi:hypothetical protein RJ53_00955 [Methanocalculus chunghsingensis]|uniref:Uncharacterized protein n=1 Tax=Methanocalculus chunghsingensis TaxID=156457 RepID=A0A8J7W893_9EURY|nr:hypothetical protein [Methanocalculus chunghsingensis]MBR1368135.1 hypothetical protein [Methanocalculus chunghsingensis]